jgi:hypothetical protein
MPIGPTAIAQIDLAIQKGRGAAASVAGQTFNVYRLNGSSSGSIVSSGNLVLQQYPARIRRTTSAQVIENAVHGMIEFIAICDNTYIENGDILIETGYGAALTEPTAYCVVSQRPTRETVFIRTETTCSIVHAHPAAGALVSQPGSGAVFQSGYGGVTPTTNRSILLTAGSYYVDPTGTGSPASIPCGLQPQNKMRDSHVLKLPTEFAREFFVLFLPPTPGYQISENDEAKLANQDTYVIRQAYTSDQSGTVGWICLVERKAT